LGGTKKKRVLAKTEVLLKVTGGTAKYETEGNSSKRNGYTRKKRREKKGDLLVHVGKVEGTTLKKRGIQKTLHQLKQ